MTMLIGMSNSFPLRPMYYLRQRHRLRFNNNNLSIDVLHTEYPAGLLTHASIFKMTQPFIFLKYSKHCHSERSEESNY